MSELKYVKLNVMSDVTYWHVEDQFIIYLYISDHNELSGWKLMDTVTIDKHHRDYEFISKKYNEVK